jgi:hypothetical protein
LETFYKDILWRALRDLPSLVSNNWLGLFMSLLVFLAIFLVKVLAQSSWKTARNRRERLIAIREHWRQNVKLGAIGVILFAWGGLFFVSLARTIYQEHKADNEKISAVEREAKTLREVKGQAQVSQSSNNRMTAHSTRIPVIRKSEAKAQNGVAIGGDNLGTATVNNTFSDVYPRPGVIPVVTFYPFPSQPNGTDYSTLIKVKTNTEITAPFWALVFDVPVIEAKVALEGISEPFGSSDGHPFKSGLKTEPLDVIPVDSRMILRPEGHERIDTDNILRIQITEIGMPFGGPYRPWGPKDLVAITVRSSQKVKLVGIISGSGRAFIPEQIIVSQP